MSTLRHWLIAGDIHLGEHNPRQVALLVKLIRTLAPTLAGVVLNGDILDVTEVHKSTAGRRQAVLPGRSPLYLLEEIVLAKCFLGALTRAVEPGTTIQFIEGNHEVRIPRLVAAAVPELHPVTPTLKELLGLDELGIGWTPYNSHFLVGDWAIEHGHRCNIHACKGLLESYLGLNAIQGHSHRLKEYGHQTPDGRTLYGVEGGHLRNPDASYLPRQRGQWQAGVVLLTEVGQDRYQHSLLPFGEDRVILGREVVTLKTNEARSFWQPARDALVGNHTRLIDAVIDGRLMEV